ncbi:hypothetical protein TNCV_3016261 [Trichonephila clavipes]|nr:hypothetical protein TNCV_3016261 [Trichonephila clavipes]
MWVIRGLNEEEYMLIVPKIYPQYQGQGIAVQMVNKILCQSWDQTYRPIGSKHPLSGTAVRRAGCRSGALPNQR